MAGYLVADVDVQNQAAYDKYRNQTAAIVETYGGRFLVRGGTIDMLEGSPDIARLIVIEFPSVGAARTFYDSAEHQAIIGHRIKNAQTVMFIAAGVDPS